MQRKNKSIPSVDDLLKVVLEEPKNAPSAKRIKRSTDDVLSFIYFYKLTKGTAQVPLALMGSLYRKWSKDPIHLAKFNKRILDFFGNGSKKGRYVYINISATDLATSIFEEETKEKPVNGKKLDKIRQFLEYKQIKPGSYYVNAIPIYVLFCNYVGIDFNGDRTYSFKTFKRVLRLFLKERTTKSDGYFGIQRSLSKTILPPEFTQKAMKHYYGKENS